MPKHHTTAAGDYLGDSVYVTLDPFGNIVLTVGGNDHEQENVIVLGPRTYAALVTYVTKQKATPRGTNA